MKNILLVIDVQHGFTSKHTEHVINRINSVLKKDLFDVVIATRFLNTKNSMYVKVLGWEGLMCERDQKLQPFVKKKADKIIDKTRYTAISREVLEFLKSLNDDKLPEYIFLMGIDTEICVLKNAVDLFENNIRPIVLKKYCASNGGMGSHRAGIASLRRFVGSSSLIDFEIESRNDIESVLSNLEKYK